MPYHPYFILKKMSNSVDFRKLVEAEKKAALLFDEIEKQQLIYQGKSEHLINQEIYQLAFKLFGIKKYWHKRIVRAGKNTLHPYDVNPENLMVQEDDIVFLDFGPIFEDWEADYGRTFVLGSDPLKLKLKEDVKNAWDQACSFYFSEKNLTGAVFYNYCCSLAKEKGWEFGGPIAGHLIGHFPHEKLEKENKTNYIHPENHISMNALDRKGKTRHWILEIHFVDRQKEIGGFFEQLLIAPIT